MRHEASAAFAAAVLYFASSAYAQSAITSSEADGCSAAEAGLQDHPEVEQMQAVFVQSRLATLQSGTAGPGSSQPQGASDLSSARLLRSEKALSMTPEQRAELVIPLGWIHVPKTGTSFCNALYHTPVVCEFFPEGVSIADSNKVGAWPPNWSPLEAWCPGGFTSSLGEVGAHMGLSEYLWELNRGHLVTMLRQPEQRLISAFKYEEEMRWSGPTTQREYAEIQAGGTVRQLTRGGQISSGELSLPTSDEVSIAIKRLREGFVFVGITEKWDLSICLFRAMFGGGCVSSDFLNTRPGNSSSGDSLYDTSELYGYVDVYDGPVYAEAQAMFRQDVQLYAVDEDKCGLDC